MSMAFYFIACGGDEESIDSQPSSLKGDYRIRFRLHDSQVDCPAPSKYCYSGSSIVWGDYIEKKIVVYPSSLFDRGVRGKIRFERKDNVVAELSFDLPHAQADASLAKVLYQERNEKGDVLFISRDIVGHLELAENKSCACQAIRFELMITGLEAKKLAYRRFNSGLIDNAKFCLEGKSLDLSASLKIDYRKCQASLNSQGSGLSTTTPHTSKLYSNGSDSTNTNPPSWPDRNQPAPPSSGGSGGTYEEDYYDDYYYDDSVGIAAEGCVDACNSTNGCAESDEGCNSSEYDSGDGCQDSGDGCEGGDSGGCETDYDSGSGCGSGGSDPACTIDKIRGMSLRNSSTFFVLILLFIAWRMGRKRRNKRVLQAVNQMQPPQAWIEKLERISSLKSII